MMKKAQYSILAAALLFMSACSGDTLVGGDNETGNGNGTVTATQELLTDDNCGTTFATTRATLTTNSKVEWKAGDAINIFDGKSNSKFVASADGTTTTFTSQNYGVSENVSKYVALYPYDIDATYTGSTISNVTLPANQNAVAGGFDPTCALMAATTTKMGSNFAFKHICGYVKFSTSFACSRVVLNFNTPVAGKFDVTFDESGNPQVSNLSETANSIVVVGDIKANTDYYVAVLPTSGNGGFSMTLEPQPTKDMVNTTTKTINVKSRSKSTTSSLSTNRAKIKNLGTLNTSNTNEDATFTIPYEDMGIGDNIATAEHGHTVLWAKINLGADPQNETEASTGEYYAWGETKPKDTYTKATYQCNDYYPLSLDAAHDAATVNWGHGWRMPTHNDFVKMKENCIFVYGTNNGKTGFYVYRGNGEIKDYQKMSDFVYRYGTGYGPASKQIDDETVTSYINALDPDKQDHLFFVFAGHKNDKSGDSNGDAARYWMNDHGDQDIYASQDQTELTAYYWGLANHTFNSLSQWQPRYAGLTIRPVFEISW